MSTGLSFHVVNITDVFLVYLCHCACRIAALEDGLHAEPYLNNHTSLECSPLVFVDLLANPLSSSLAVLAHFSICTCRCINIWIALSAGENYRVSDFITCRRFDKAVRNPPSRALCVSSIAHLAQRFPILCEWSAGKETVKDTCMNSTS
jgi:hypothetical protein